MHAIAGLALVTACTGREQQAAAELGLVIPSSPDSVSSMLTLAVGFVLSFLGSLPMTGPLALLVLDRVVSGQRRSALWIASSGALVEGFVAAVIATLLPLVLRHSERLVSIGRMSGAVVIFIVGLVLVLRPQTVTELDTSHRRRSLLVGFLATSLNPTLIATWTIAVTALHANGLLEGGLRQGALFGAGVVLGVLGWFVLLLGLAKLSAPERMRRHRAAFGRGVGGILLLLGVLTFAHWLLASGQAQ